MLQAWGKVKTCADSKRGKWKLSFQIAGTAKPVPNPIIPAKEGHIEPRLAQKRCNKLMHVLISELSSSWRKNCIWPAKTCWLHYQWFGSCLEWSLEIERYRLMPSTSRSHCSHAFSTDKLQCSEPNMITLMPNIADTASKRNQRLDIDSNWHIHCLSRPTSCELNYKCPLTQIRLTQRPS